MLLERRVLGEKTPSIAAVSFYPDDESIICLALENSTVLLWNRQSDEIHRLPNGHRFSMASPSCDVALASPHGNVIFGYESGEVRWHNLLLSPKRGGWTPLGAHRGPVLALDATSTHLYSGGSDGTILVTPLLTHTQKPKAQVDSRILLDGLGAMSTLAVSSDSQLLACGCDDGTVQLWRLTAYGTQATLDWTSRKQRRPIHSLTFSPNGNMLISRNSEGALCLLASRTGYELPLAPEAQTSYTPPVFAADSRLLGLSNSQDSLSIFDAWTGKLRHTLPSSVQNLQNFVFAPAIYPEATDTLLVVVGSQEIAVWQVPL